MHLKAVMSARDQTWNCSIDSELGTQKCPWGRGVGQYKKFKTRYKRKLQLFIPHWYYNDHISVNDFDEIPQAIWNC